MLSIVRAFPVLDFVFSPILTIGGFVVRVDAIALAIVILVSLLVAARIARRTPVDPARPADDRGPDDGEPNHLRADDLLYVAVATLPGAVVGGRLGYALLHIDFYTANSSALLDPNQGSLELSLSVVGGFLTATIVARLLGAPLGRWMHALALPVLLALAGGKLAMAFGGSGQGMPWDGAWATAYLGVGPWGSPAAAIPAHPSQVYEALTTAGVVLVMAGLLALGAFARRTGTALLVGIALWSVARAAVASTWRDPVVVGPLRMEQAICLVLTVIAVALTAVITAAERRRAARGPERAGADQPAWPEPGDRPRI